MKTYNILELQKMNHAELVEVCNEMQPALVSTHKQHMIYAILDRQADLNYRPINVGSYTQGRTAGDFLSSRKTD